MAEPDLRTVPVALPEATACRMEYATSVPVESEVEFWESEFPRYLGRSGGARPVPRRTRGGVGTTARHQVRLDALKPAVRYAYRVRIPEGTETPMDLKWGGAPGWSREYCFSTEALTGWKTIERRRIKVLLMPNVLRLESGIGDPRAWRSLPGRMAAGELSRVRDRYAEVALFYWLNSRMRLWLDFDLTVDARLQSWGEPVPEAPGELRQLPRCRSYSGTEVRNPGGGEFTVFDPAQPERVFSGPVAGTSWDGFAGQVEQAFPRRWNRREGRWELYASGGATIGYDDLPRGVPARSQFLGGFDTAWLAAHEIHHQLEFLGELFLAPHPDRLAFNHYLPHHTPPGARRLEDPERSTLAGPHGDHWDGMRYWDRRLAEGAWLRLPLGTTLAVTDADGDGVPDSDERLPLDEARLGTRSTAARSFNGIADMDRALLLSGVAGPLQPDAGRPTLARWEGLRHGDLDEDGIPDDRDPAPLIPFPTDLPSGECRVDGTQDEWTTVHEAGTAVTPQGARAVLKHMTDAAGYSVLLAPSGEWTQVELDLDGEGRGLLSGQGAVRLTISRSGSGKVSLTVSRPGTSVVLGDVPWKRSQGKGGADTFEVRLPVGPGGAWEWLKPRRVAWALRLSDRTGAVRSSHDSYRLLDTRGAL